MKTRPRPTRIRPDFLPLSPLQTICIIMPMNTKSCRRVVMGNALSAATCAVTVVPILAAACRRFMIPTLTKPTISTVVTPELWMSAVVAAPTPTLTSRRSAVLPNSFLIRPVASCSMLVVSRCTPVRNTPVPASSRTANITISKAAILFLLLPSRRETVPCKAISLSPPDSPALASREHQFSVFFRGVVPRGNDEKLKKRGFAIAKQQQSLAISSSGRTSSRAVLMAGRASY